MHSPVYVQVTVICDSGYEVVSGDETLVCDATSNPGSWVGIVPVCDRRQCPTITVPDSMSSPQGPHYYTDTVTYSCTSGYNLTGELNIAKPFGNNGELWCVISLIKFSLLCHCGIRSRS